MTNSSITKKYRTQKNFFIGAQPQTFTIIYTLSSVRGEKKITVLIKLNFPQYHQNAYMYTCISGEIFL